MKISWTARKLVVVLAALVPTCFVTACGHDESIEMTTHEHAGIVAGYGEESFTERYHLRLSLPMPEAHLLSLLKKLELSYGVCGERGSMVGLPPPRHPNKVDLSKAQKCYQVYGDIDPIQHIGKGYRVFVDRNHQVIYIENAFAYTGP